ncbi:MAG TPA: glucokinase [Thiobacillaceae bacterium]|nr:glucokinase [Thiobacillaceae bacterium]HNU64327.1 glucokinase [Thiobacillaceae bacterium]
MVLNILVGDIGGTHSRLAQARVAGQHVSLVDVQRYRNAHHSSLTGILTEYLRKHAYHPRSACLAVAGSTDGRQVHFTNLDWHVHADALARELGMERVSLVNDFSAVGWGLDALQTRDLCFLQTGPGEAEGVRVAVGAGTGLGVSLCVPQRGRYRPLSSEGGHMGFAPQDDEQDRLLQFLRGLHGRVSVERVVSGPGIVDLYRFCAREAGLGEPPLLAQTEPPQAISQAAQVGGDPVALRTMQLFVRIYGQIAGDVALLARARGGVFLAGGIASKNLPLMQAPEFLAGFHAKGRFSAWMREIPVAVVLDADIGLRGAALAAAT